MEPTTADPIDPYQTRRNFTVGLVLVGLVLLVAAAWVYHSDHAHWIAQKQQAGADALFGLNLGVSVRPPSAVGPVVMAIAGAFAIAIGAAIGVTLPVGAADVQDAVMDRMLDADGRPPARRHAMHIHRGR